jgi:hypothetical protein
MLNWTMLSMNTVLAATPVASRAPSIEDVVLKEGFTPTPSQSDIYRPGAVLVPNDRGGHDMVVETCVPCGSLLSAAQPVPSNTKSTSI